ncbi:MAG: hypothetical protein K9N09_00855 [Candidatus Cloacimonetes bacterium]|nr:hypothetical protein [Candidatus Cloacimonadota bacterium]MCF7813035.1 hypothetical protein [Candidatus Cloacimonadota bacterium]MCF7867224.1 hypothetical protein [Candidatus Cloacimonadota bacterium]MCF7882668.1 hypothetical protein [Candidatus Cloacimonadota bacterium]
MKSPILFRQHALVKLLYVIIQTLIISFSNINFFIILTVFNLFFFLILQPLIIKNWIFTIIKLLPLYISILVFSLIFTTPFLQQLYLLGRLSLILLLSVFLVNTSTIYSFVADTVFLNRFRFTSDVRYFLVAVIFFIPEMVEQFKQAAGRKLSISGIIGIFEKSLNSIQKVEEKAEKSIDDEARKFDLISNLTLILMMFLIVFSYYKDISCVI